MGSEIAMDELKRLKELALNTQEKSRLTKTVVVTLNIRSLNKHFVALTKDFQMRAKVINLQETWCCPEEKGTDYQIQGYQLHMVNQVSGTINKENYQMLKLKGVNFDVINVYCSRGANKVDFLRDLGSLAAAQRPCFITGDFNINYLRDPKDSIVAKILSCGFSQIVKGHTHKT